MTTGYPSRILMFIVTVKVPEPQEKSEIAMRGQASISRKEAHAKLFNSY